MSKEIVINVKDASVGTAAGAAAGAASVITSAASGAVGATAYTSGLAGLGKATCLATVCGGPMIGGLVAAVGIAATVGIAGYKLSQTIRESL